MPRNTETHRLQAVEGTGGVQSREYRQTSEELIQISHTEKGYGGPLICFKLLAPTDPPSTPPGSVSGGWRVNGGCNGQDGAGFLGQKVF